MPSLSLSLSLSLALPAGSYSAHFFPMTRGRQKTLHKVIVSLCLSVALIALYCVYAFLASEYVAAGFPSSRSTRRPRPSAAPPAAPSITFSPPRLKRLSAFRLLIRLSPFSGEWARDKRGHPRSHLFLPLKSQDDWPPRYYRQIFTRRGAGGRPLSVALCFFAAHLLTV